MKVYLASRFVHQALCRYVAAELETSGHKITYKWFDPALAVEASAQNIDDARTAEVARKEFNGVVSADVVFHLVDNVGGTGSWVECGVAFGCGVPVFAMSVRGELPPYRSIFDTLYTARVPSVKEFLKCLEQLEALKRGSGS